MRAPQTLSSRSLSLSLLLSLALSLAVSLALSLDLSPSRSLSLVLSLSRCLALPRVSKTLSRRSRSGPDGSCKQPTTLSLERFARDLNNAQQWISHTRDSGWAQFQGNCINTISLRGQSRHWASLAKGSRVPLTALTRPPQTLSSRSGSHARARAVSLSLSLWLCLCLSGYSEKRPIPR